MIDSRANSSYRPRYKNLPGAYPGVDVFGLGELEEFRQRLDAVCGGNRDDQAGCDSEMPES